MPLWDFRAHATWQTCLSSYVFTFLADTWKSRSAGGCIHRCRRLSRGCKPTREDSPRFWQRRKVVRALRAAPPITARRAFCSANSACGHLGQERRARLCYSQIGGLGVATFITLLLVPVFYAIFVLDLKLITWDVTAKERQ